MKHYNVTIGEKKFDIEVIDDPRKEEVRVKVDGEELTVKIETIHEEVASYVNTSAMAASSGAALNAAAPVVTVSGAANTVKAPLPGVIHSIKVRTGQKVSPNDELCVIEAMKAMNIIRATRSGVIGKIYVTEGRKIAHGAALLDIE